MKNSAVVTTCVAAFLAGLALVQPSVAEECIQPPIDCPKGSAITDDPYLSRYPELDKYEISSLFYCEFTEEKGISHRLHDTTVVGVDKSCNTTLRGTYNDASTSLTYYWQNGSRKRHERFGDGIAEEQYYDEAGHSVDDGLLGVVGEIDVPLNAIKLFGDDKDMFSYLDLSDDAVRTCGEAIETRFDLERIEETLRDHGLSLIYRGISARTAILLTQPVRSADAKSSTFYKYAISLNACDAKNICSVGIYARNYRAPIENEQIRLSKAIKGDDELTTTLGEISKAIVERPTIWCSWGTLPDVRDLFGTLGFWNHW